MSHITGKIVNSGVLETSCLVTRMDCLFSHVRACIDLCKCACAVHLYNTLLVSTCASVHEHSGQSCWRSTHHEGHPTPLTAGASNNFPYLAHRRITFHFFPSSQGFAVTLAKAVTSLDLPVAIVNLKEYDPDDNLIGEVGICLCVFFCN